MSVELSVLLPARDAAATIGEQLDALASQRTAVEWELVVADNGSSDGTLAIVERYRDRLPGLIVVDASARRGAAYALNRAAEAARGASLGFCDADDVVADGWLDALAAGLRKHEFVACRLETARLNTPAVRRSRDEVLDTELPRVAFLPDVPHAATAGMGVRRDVLTAVGGFDEDVSGVPDTDLCIRLALRGVELVLVPDAVVHYRYRTGARETFRQARAYAEANALLQRRYAPRRIHPLWKWPLTGWKPIVGALPAGVRGEGRLRLAWLLGWQAGRYAGSLRHRVLAA